MIGTCSSLRVLPGVLHALALALTVSLGLFLGALGLYGISTFFSQVLSAAARTILTKCLLVLHSHIHGMMGMSVGDAGARLVTTQAVSCSVVQVVKHVG